MSTAPNSAPGSKPTLGERWRALKARLQALFDEYGPIAMVIWFSIFGLSIFGFSMALKMGVDVGMDTAEMADKERGVVASFFFTQFGPAYLLTQLIKPLRILLTLGLTPPVAKLIRRGKSQDGAADVEE